MFQPNSIDFNLDTTLYSVNIATNSITVQGCQVPASLTTSPFGSVEFYFIKLPDYITGTDPIDITGYS